MHIIAVLFLLTQPVRETNPVKIVINSGIDIYQELISPSQGDVCNFSPSCSHFAQQAIVKYGPLWGPLMAADRFMRCNGCSFQHVHSYYSGVKRYKIYDPVENNYIFSETRMHTNKDTNEHKYGGTNEHEYGGTSEGE